MLAKIPFLFKDHWHKSLVVVNQLPACLPAEMCQSVAQEYHSGMAKNIAKLNIVRFLGFV